MLNMKIVVLAIFWLAELIVLPFFIKAGYPTRTTKSFILKVVLASIYLAAGLVAVFCLWTPYVYSKAAGSGMIDFSSTISNIVKALMLGWVGDVMLGVAHFFDVKNKKLADVISFLGAAVFFAGHVFYVVAFLMGIKTINGSIPWWLWVIAAVIAVLWSATLQVLKVKLGKLLVFNGIYGAGISLMMTSAIVLGGMCIAKGNILLGILLILGSVGFTSSDYSLTCESYGDDCFDKFGFRAQRQVAYFVGQMMFATTLVLW